VLFLLFGLPPPGGLEPATPYRQVDPARSARGKGKEKSETSLFLSGCGIFIFGEKLVGDGICSHISLLADLLDGVVQNRPRDFPIVSETRPPGRGFLADALTAPLWDFSPARFEVVCLRGTLYGS
jgi:hypothetical protein